MKNNSIIAVFDCFTFWLFTFSLFYYLVFFCNWRNFEILGKLTKKYILNRFFIWGVSQGLWPDFWWLYSKKHNPNVLKKVMKIAFKRYLESLSNSKAKRYTLHSTFSAILKLRISGNNFQLKMIFCVPDSRDGLFELSRNVEEGPIQLILT